MSDVLDYGRRRSRRHWRVVAAAVVLAAGALVGVRARQEHLAQLQAIQQQRAAAAAAAAATQP